MFVSAFTTAAAKEKFDANPDIVAIVVDACVPGEVPNTGPLVREFRKKFTGPIIAASSVKKYRHHLRRAGCDYVSTKSDLPQMLREVLSL